MATGRNKKALWLLGARVWVEYRIGHKPELYDFIGFDNFGVYYFQRKRDSVVVGKTMYHLTQYPGFRPFLINFEYFDPNRLVMDESRETPTFTKKESYAST
jgi:hypothetical protein